MGVAFSLSQLSLSKSTFGLTALGLNEKVLGAAGNGPRGPQALQLRQLNANLRFGKETTTAGDPRRPSGQQTELQKVLSQVLLSSCVTRWNVSGLFTVLDVTSVIHKH